MGVWGDAEDARCTSAADQWRVTAGGSIESFGAREGQAKPGLVHGALLQETGAQCTVPMGRGSAAHCTASGAASTAVCVVSRTAGRKAVASRCRSPPGQPLPLATSCSACTGTRASARKSRARETDSGVRLCAEGSRELPSFFMQWLIHLVFTPRTSFVWSCRSLRGLSWGDACCPPKRKRSCTEFDSACFRALQLCSVSCSRLRSCTASTR